jgi:hypothetical protein
MTRAMFAPGSAYENRVGIDLCEKPFYEQLELMDWQWLEGDTGVPYLTERESFREIMLK